MSNPVPPYLIIVPVFNQEDNLDNILNKIKALGYLDRINFVNDASTDRSKMILDRWKVSDGINVFHLAKNLRKEGAILAVLEKLKESNRLPEKTIILDSDSYLLSNTDGKSLCEVLAQCIEYMDQQNISGMAFRMDPIVPPNATFLQRAQYAEYIGTRFWNYLAAKQWKLWVINGPGGIFRSDVLLNTLRGMAHDFETGDLLITVKMMKENHRVGYYPGIKVHTTVPSTMAGLFKQRRRWTRGVLKVVMEEYVFYIKQFLPPNFIALQVGIFVSPNFMFVQQVAAGFFHFFQLHALVVGYLSGVLSSTIVAFFEKGVKKEGEILKIMKWSFLQGFVYPAVIMPANIFAFFEVLKYCLFEKVPEISYSAPQ